MMEYQNIANLLNNAPNQPSKVGARNWVEINGESEEHTIGMHRLNLKRQC